MTDEKVQAVSLADMVDTAIPDEPGVPVESDSGLYCETCGKPLTYSGKGRKPKYCEEHRKTGRASNLNPGGTRASGDVKAAVNTLDMAYSAVQMVLLMTGANQAAKALGDSLPGLRAQNEQFLTQDKDLAKKINAMGKTGGRYAFFAAQIMVLGPVGVLAAGEYREKFANKVVNDDGENAPDVPPTMGGFPVAD